MPIIKFGKPVEDEWDTDLILKELQEKLLPAPYNPITLDGEDEPIHKNKKPSLLKGELDFKSFPFNKDITVSNIGRVKYNGSFADQKEKKGVFYIKTTAKEEYVHRIVAFSWRNKGNTLDNYDNGASYRTTVHHLDNNGYNNDYNNLLWVTPYEHTMIHIKGTWGQGKRQLPHA